MQIRLYQESDRPFLRRLYLAARKTAFHWRDTSHYQPKDFDRATLGEEIWVAEENGIPLGFVSIHRAEDFIHNLYVDPAQQTRGIGSTLLKQAESTFRTTGALKCLVRNEPALVFYQRHGWRIISQGGEGEDAYYLLHSAAR
ncbi:GNAT family N-acetyltransferase [Serratia sp. Tan611]|uniref:GNAT family N-acetyltransferase n=1 Tax=Serratia sp. Tan611 TaxID=2773264 RepID=UPI0019334664|nr:GNAT family N-acetyltransferase [Serratia sp. Tan611]CAE1148802.1 GNAT family N-acetyltransferase [Serratia sp. Tan611]